MSGKDLFQKVKELNLPKGKYALFGSAPMGVRGIRECHDIDIIAKKKKNIESINLQVKSRYNEGLPSIFTANIKSTLVNNKKMVIIFCFFDTRDGDLADYLWLVPADEFILKANKINGGSLLGFVAGPNKKDGNKWDEYMIEKKDLANKILEII